jgi:hypothetical protein
MKTYELYVGQCQPNVSTVKMNLTVEIHMSLTGAFIVLSVK